MITHLLTLSAEHIVPILVCMRLTVLVEITFLSYHYHTLWLSYHCSYHTFMIDIWLSLSHNYDCHIIAVIIHSWLTYDYHYHTIIIVISSPLSCNHHLSDDKLLSYSGVPKLSCELITLDLSVITFSTYFFSYASSSTLHPRQPMSESVIVSD